MSIPDNCEAYIEVKAAWGRMTGGTLAECQEFWKHGHEENEGCASRLVLQDGTVLAERGIVGERLRRRVVARLKARQWNDADADIIQEVAFVKAWARDKDQT